MFSSRSIVSWSLAGPLQQHFDLAFAGTPDGIFPPRRDKPYFDATLKMDAFALPVSLRVRGNSSLQECPFPKLKLKIAKEDRVNTPFFDAREIKVGSHCADGGRGNIGRLRDERAAYREALAYETMELLGFASPRVRRARIDYRDTAPPSELSNTGWQVTRNAVILEDIEVLAERMGGRALSDQELGELRNANFNDVLIASLELLHALLGNWDYALSMTGEGLWNTDVVELVSGQFVPVAGDFDLASWVTEVARLSAPRDFRPELEDIERQALYQVDQIRSRVDKPTFTTASRTFLELRRAIESLINAAEIDDPGRVNALRHVTAFYTAIAEAGR